MHATGARSKAGCRTTGLSKRSRAKTSQKENTSGSQKSIASFFSNFAHIKRFEADVIYARICTHDPTGNFAICSAFVRVMTCFLEDGEGVGVLGESTLPQFLYDVNKWHHVTLTFSDRVQGTRSVIQVHNTYYA